MKKYEMTPSQWATARKKIEQTTDEGSSWSDAVLGVVELGHLTITPAVYDGEEITTPAVLSTKVAIDILWSGEPVATFASKQVWPAPCGVHTFAGWEAAYAADFCEANPDHPYCNPVITESDAS
jgi:hypothetical protein